MRVLFKIFFFKILFIQLIFLCSFFTSQKDLYGQVLSLNNNEYVKVEAKLNESVPYHRYKSLINVDIWDNLPVDLAAKEARNKYLSDTSALIIQDTVYAFFVWKGDELLRIICRKEVKTKKNNKNKLNLSLPVTSLFGQNINDFYDKVNQLQRKSSCVFIGKPLSNLVTNNLSNPQCILLVVKENLKQNTYYRIFNISSFKISKGIEGSNEYHCSKYLKPNYSFHHWYVGFSSKEIIYNENRKPRYWQYKLGNIYEHLFSLNSFFEGAKPVPFFNIEEIQGWPWNQNFKFNCQHQFSFFYLGNRIGGYRVFNKNSYTETGGFVVVPGKFFLPRRLQIIAVNNIPWKN